MADWSERVRRILAGRTRLEIPSDAEDPPLIRAAVLMPLYEVEGQIYVLLTRRTDIVDRHKGQVSFPGGRCDATDRDALDTALREAYEEIGLPRAEVEILGALDDMLTSTGFVVTPYVGRIPYPYQLTPNAHEVAAVLHVPLAVFINPVHYREEIWERHGQPVPVHFYRHDEDVIWGATARMIRSFLELAAETALRPPVPPAPPGLGHYLQAPAGRVHYLEWGAAGRPALVLLHGALQTAHSWEDCARAVADRYHLFALDQRGHGDSDRAEHYSLDDYVGDLDAGLAHWRTGPVILLGMSMGGLNALVYAARHPERVRALVLIDAGPELDAAGVRAVQNFITSVPDDFASLEEAVAVAHVYNPRRSEENLRRRLSHNLRRRPDGRWAWKYDRRFKTMGSVYSARPADLWDEWRRVACPTLVIRGQESNVLTGEGTRKMLERRPQTVLAEVAGAGHSVVGDNLEGFLAALEPFLLGL